MLTLCVCNCDSSILFFVAYAVLAPFVVLRLARKSSRTLVLVRPAVFLSIRLATYVVRAIQANGNESEGLFVAEQVSFPTRTFRGSVTTMSSPRGRPPADLPALRVLPLARTLVDLGQVQPVPRLDPSRQEGLARKTVASRPTCHHRRDRPRDRRQFYPINSPYS